MKELNKKRALLLSVIAISFILVGCTTSSTINNNPPANNSNQNSTKTEVSNGFTATSTYTATNTWNYIVKGDLPTPCHTLDVEAIVRESFPEQVTLKATLKAPTGDTICAQVLEPIEKTGTYAASADATFKFEAAR